MAVQAQYPSNILLLNRNVQEGKSPLLGGGDYALKQQQQQQQQPQSGGGLFLDHTNIMPLHHNTAPENNNNSRKRARDYTTTATAAAATVAAAPPQSSDSPLTSMQRPNFVDLTQLNNNTHQKLTTTNTNNRNMVSTGLGLAFGDQQLPRQQQQQHHHQHKNSISPQSSAQSSVLLSLLSDELGSHIKQQRQEIEHFLLAQGEELRRTLAEKRQKHFRTILTAAEESLARRLREREAEVEKAARRNAELEAKAAQLSLEAQAWQARARMQESYAATLQMQLQQAIISGAGAAGGGHGQVGGAQQLQDVCDEWEGGNSTAVMGGGEAEDAESAYIDPDRVVVVSQPSCKACRNRAASVVLLPCRHMCLCTECDAVAQACPVCLSLRCSSIEVFFS